MNRIRFVIPGKLSSEPNQRGSWKAKHFGRTEPQRRKAREKCPKWEGPPLLVVTLFRYGARLLDSDNLQGAFKATRDGIASKLGIDDGSPLIAWEYLQATCPFGEERVEVVIEPTGATKSGEWWRAAIFSDGTDEGVIRQMVTQRATPQPAVYRPRKP